MRGRKTRDDGRGGIKHAAFTRRGVRVFSFCASAARIALRITRSACAAAPFARGARSPHLLQRAFCSALRRFSATLSASLAAYF